MKKYLIFFIILMSVVHIASATEPPFYLPAGQEVTITLTAYDGSTVTQHVHPTVLKFTTKINGYYYIIGITPYPNGNDKYENPSVVFSNDLINYTEDNVSNPLVPPPPSGHYADPDMVYDPKNNRIIYYATFGDTPEGFGVIILTSIDGVNWTVVNKAYYEVVDSWIYVSPTVVYDPSEGVFKIWIVKYNRGNYTKQLVYTTSLDGTNFSFSNLKALNYNKPYHGGSYYNPWHIAVHKVGNEYWMISACNPVGTRNGGAPIHLFFANSTDGINWTFYDEPILNTSASLATDSLYRADFLVENGTLYVLYSYLNADGTWHVALTSTDVSHLVGNISSDNVVTPIVKEFLPKATYHKLKIFSSLNFTVTLNYPKNCTWRVNGEPVHSDVNTYQSWLNLTFNKTGIYNISLEVNGIIFKWVVEVYKPYPVLKLFAPSLIRVGQVINISVLIENLNELYDYQIEVDFDNDGVPEIVTKDFNVTLPAFQRPAKYKITVSVVDPVTNAVNKSEFYLQVYAFRLFKGYNIMNTTGAVIYAESTEPVHAEIKPIKVTKDFTVIVSEENIYANNTSDIILNVTFVGLAGGDKVWLNETVANAISVDLLHNGEPILTAIPVKNYSVNITLTTFSTYTLVVNNTVTPPKIAPPPEEMTIEEILIFVGIAVGLVAVVAGAIYLAKRTKAKTLARMESEFRFFRRLK